MYGSYASVQSVAFVLTMPAVSVVIQWAMPPADVSALIYGSEHDGVSTRTRSLGRPVSSILRVLT